MSKNWAKDFTCVTGAVRFSDLAYLAMAGDALSRLDVVHTYFSEWDAGTWRDGGKVDWPVAGIAIAREPLQQMCAVGVSGGVKLMGSGDVHEEQISASRPLRGVRTVGARVYVAGMNRQVWRRDGAHQWVSFGPDGSTSGVVGFEAIDGFSENELYTVGWDGEIWQFDGASWSQRASPVTQVLTRMCCGGDGLVYASGRRGLLIRGRGERWELVNHESLIDDVWDLAWYRDTLYVSTMYGVYTLAGDKLEPVDFGEDVPQSCYHLSANDGVLWSIGPKDVMAFDGQVWKRID